MSGEGANGNAGRNVHGTADALSERILAAINDIDEELIADAAAFRAVDRSVRSAWRRSARMLTTGLAAAAIIGIVVLAGGGLRRMPHNASFSSSTTQRADNDVFETAAVTEEATEEEMSMESAQEDDVAEVPAESASLQESAAADAADGAAMDAGNGEMMIGGAWTGYDQAASKEAGEEQASDNMAREETASLVAPPVLMLIGDDAEYAIAANSATWTTQDADGMATTWSVDAAAPSDSGAQFPKIPCTDGVLAVRSPDVAAFALILTPTAEHITVNAWDATTSTDGKLAPLAKDLARAYKEVNNFQVDGLPVESTWLLRKGCRYEVVATWGTEGLDTCGGYGVARYVFEVE